MKNVFIIIATIICFSYFLLSMDNATRIYSNDKVATISMNNIYNQNVDGQNTKEKNHMSGLNVFINNKKINDYYVTGNIKDGYFDGKVEIRDSKSKLIFEGDFELGVYAGHTRFYDKYGVTYEGYVKNGLQDGFGRDIFVEDGVMRWSYEGDFKDGQKNGYGIITVFDDDTGIEEYQGVFVNDTFNGKYYKTEKLYVPKIEYIKMMSTEEEKSETKLNIIVNKIKKSNQIIVTMLKDICTEIALSAKELIDISVDKIDSKKDAIIVFNETKQENKIQNNIKSNIKNDKKESNDRYNASNDTKVKQNINAILKEDVESEDENIKKQTITKKEKFVIELKKIIEEIKTEELKETKKKLIMRIENLVRNKNETLDDLTIEEALVLTRRLLVNEKFINDSNETKKVSREFITSEWARTFIPYNLALMLNCENLKEEIKKKQIDIIKEFVKNEIKNNNII